MLNAGLDPEGAMKEVLVANIYNVRQTQLADKLVKLAVRNDVRLVAVMYAMELFRYRDYPALIALLGEMPSARNRRLNLSSLTQLGHRPTFARDYCLGLTELNSSSPFSVARTP